MDLALVQLVGVIVGTYSSIFFATPLLVSLRERTELVRTHTRRVINRRKGATARAVPNRGERRRRTGGRHCHRHGAQPYHAAAGQTRAGCAAGAAVQRPDRTPVG